MVTNGKVLKERNRLATELESRLLKEAVDLWDNLIDPNDAFRGPNGDIWNQVGLTSGGELPSMMRSESDLEKARKISRDLCERNEFAINAAENRVSYVVGTGHNYTLAPKADGVPDDLVESAQAVIDDFVESNRWHHRQQESQRRLDRDGEVFIRLFSDLSGMVRVRYVEPGQVKQPRGNREATFGIDTAPDDVETAVAYWIDGERVDARNVQHRRQGVDANVKRGVPLFWPVSGTLQRIEKLQRNMDAVAGIQTAIAMIRKHESGVQSTVEAFQRRLAALTGTIKQFGDQHNSKPLTHYGPGTVLDVPKTQEYEFPSSGIDASKFVAVKQAALRQVAARLVMPEFMLSADASNANFSSTLVSEGPTVKYFERLQMDTWFHDRMILHKQLSTAAAAGLLPENILDLVSINVGMPRLTVRDRLQEAQADQLYNLLGVKSHQTISAGIGLDYDDEQANFAAHRANEPDDFPPLTPAAFDDDESDDDNAVEDEDGEET